MEKSDGSGSASQSLTAIQFPPLRHLKKLDLSSCGLRRINTKAFVNLGSSVETIRLHDNLLQNVRGETFENLHGLKVILSTPQRLGLLKPFDSMFNVATTFS